MPRECLSSSTLCSELPSIYVRSRSSFLPLPRHRLAALGRRPLANPRFTALARIRPLSNPRPHPFARQPSLTALSRRPLANPRPHPFDPCPLRRLLFLYNVQKKAFVGPCRASRAGRNLEPTAWAGGGRTSPFPVQVQVYPDAGNGDCH